MVNLILNDLNFIKIISKLNFAYEKISVKLVGLFFDKPFDIYPLYGDFDASRC